METGYGRMVAVAALTLFLLLLISINSVPVHAANLYTRTDELVCGDTKVQAFTTCTEDSEPRGVAVCTDQYFLFTNMKTGKSVRTNGPGKLVVRYNRQSGKTEMRYRGVALSWACESNKRNEPYLHMLVHSKEHGGPWDELWDLKGKRLASNEGDTDEDWRRFYRVWTSKGLVVHPLPIMDLVTVQVFKADSPEEGVPKSWGFFQEP